MINKKVLSETALYFGNLKMPKGYGVEIDSDSCNIIINYDDNRRKNLRHEIKLKTNEFIIFPSSMSYYIKNENNSYLNFIQSILYTRV